MIRRDVVDLLHLIERFVDGGEQTKSIAVEIEGLVIECFQEEGVVRRDVRSAGPLRPGAFAAIPRESGLVIQLTPIAVELRKALQDAPDEA